MAFIMYGGMVLQSCILSQHSPWIDWVRPKFAEYAYHDIMIWSSLYCEGDDASYAIYIAVPWHYTRCWVSFVTEKRNTNRNQFFACVIHISQKKIIACSNRNPFNNSATFEFWREVCFFRRQYGIWKSTCRSETLPVWSKYATSNEQFH